MLKRVQQLVFDRLLLSRSNVSVRYGIFDVEMLNIWRVQKSGSKVGIEDLARAAIPPALDGSSCLDGEEGLVALQRRNDRVGQGSRIWITEAKGPSQCLDSFRKIWPRYERSHEFVVILGRSVVFMK